VYLASEDGRRWFVRKVARGEHLAGRLRRQVRKQEAFRRSVGELVPAPAIRAEGEVGSDLYWCDMDVVRGDDAASFLQRASYAEVRRFADLWCDYLRAASGRPGLVARPGPRSLAEALAAKVREVERAGAAVSPPVRRFLELELDRVRRFPSPPPTLCHGDLTLENIIVTPSGQPWVVDLLDAPYESYWQDVAKLHQDLAGGWHRVREIAISRGVLSYLSRRLLETMAELDPDYPSAHHLLLVVTLLRVLPYATSAGEADFLRGQVRRLAERTEPIEPIEVGR
jgi:aminoglycoside phosphotransferase (APT) family kinase protein